MDQGLKERLVGAAVLIAVAVWLIPWVLDGPEAPLETTGGSLQLPAAEEPMPMRTQTLRLGDPEPGAESAAAEPPAEAETPPAVAAPPQENASTAGDAPTVAAVLPEPERTPPVVTTPAPRTAPAATPRAAPAAAAATGDWTVQLGVFGEEANARRLAQRTNTFGYKAEVSSYRSGDRTLYRVRVGNAKTRGEAEATASALKAHGLNDARAVSAR